MFNDLYKQIEFDIIDIIEWHDARMNLVKTRKRDIE